LLLPRHARWFGFPMIAIGVVMGVAKLAFGRAPQWLDLPAYALHAWYFRPRSFEWITTNLTEEVAMGTLLVGLYCVAFVREPVEYPELATLRLRALIWAFWLNGLVALVLIFSVFGTSFIYVLTAQLYSVVLLYMAIYGVLRRSHVGHTLSQQCELR
jgi:hypothetical protein